MLNTASPKDDSPYFKGELPRRLLKQILVHDQQHIPS